MLALMKKLSLFCLIVLASVGVASPSFSKSCPANIGDYGYEDGRGGSFGETLMALNMNAPHCVCKLNKQWIKEWYYGWGDATGRQEFANWVKRCNR